ncbi:hypothetical protein Y032_0092g2546 [Ancylostoma ceylanicum]|uniref:Uncharacterized protein n=1 Tax=Ancylostoma ceylanicum TaxID=53326 RepID=A0A016TLY5_9BILA|nr:hypothetical protein Y032_0092g2546 [Ancylostoma ceylanicum]
MITLTREVHEIKLRFRNGTYMVGGLVPNDVTDYIGILLDVAYPRDSIGRAVNHSTNKLSEGRFESSASETIMDSRPLQDSYRIIH